MNVILIVRKGFTAPMSTAYVGIELMESTSYEVHDPWMNGHYGSESGQFPEEVNVGREK
jgi:hypothetical protein